MAGRLRLAVTGIQDQWLTGEPQFSYFVMNYKRHTRFAVEADESPFFGEIKFGETVTCRVPNNKGDLVRSMMIKIILDPIEQTQDESISLYNTSTGSRIIEYVDLVIGGQTIERLTGEYIYMYDQIHNSKDDVLQGLYFLNSHGDHIQFRQPFTFYVNLPFYFFRHPSLAIPVCAITKQLVEVRIKFKPADYKIGYRYLKLEDGKYRVTSLTSGKINNVSLITDFYFVTDEEKNFLLTRPVEYVITQLQLATIPIEPGESKRSVLIKFQHPIKELMFVATLSERDFLSRYPLSGVEPVTDLDLALSSFIPLRSDHRRIKNISLEFNGNKVFEHSGNYLAYQQSYHHHTGCPSPAYEFYTYSFALKPEVYYPTGQVNMSRVIHKKLTIELDEVDNYNETIVNVYAINYK